VAFDSYPNSAHNSRAISLAELEQLTYPLGGTGLLDWDGNTPIIGDGSGRQVKLRAGVKALIRGFRFVNTSETVIDNTMIIANTSGSPRVDLVVLRLDRAKAAPNAFTIYPFVITGAPGTTPVAPQPVRNITTDGSGVYDIPLAEVAVANGATSLTQANVTNRAWWVTTSGYTGFDLAKPPVEPNVTFRANDTGITYVGTSGGTWQVLYRNGGWVGPIAVPSGWSPLAYSFIKLGDMVIMNARLLRTGAAVAATVNSPMGTLGETYRPSQAMYGAYHCTSPAHSSYCAIGTDGTITFAGTGSGGDPINTNAALLCNMSWPVAA
jgi:hypothetical protein